MSQRSILEINHDQSYAIVQRPELFVALLMQALGSGSDKNWEPLRHFGIHRVVQCHHTEDRKVLVGAGGLQREYPIG